MAFGTKTGSLKALKKSLASSGGQGAWIKYIPKNGSMNVRFLQEPEEWVNYNEHFDSALRKSFPCTNETDCPGCLTQERKSNRYLANAVDLDNKRVIPLQLPKDLANRLVVRYEKYGTLTDRDYELSRAGEGLDTTYDLDPSAPTRMRLTSYQPLDLLQVLQDAYDSVFGPSGVSGNGVDEAEVPAAKTGAVKTRKRSAAATKTLTKPAVQEEDVEVDDDEDEDESTPEPIEVKAKTRTKAPAKSAKKPEPKFEPEPEDEEDDEEEVEEVEEDDDEDEIVYDEDSLRSLPLGALRAVARDFGVEVKGRKKEQIIQDILDAGEEVDDDEPPF